MSEWIDHVAKACQRIEWATEWQRGEGSTDATENAHALIAQAHATLALVEQQRIANLVALANAHHMNSAYDDTTEASRAAAYELIEYVQLSIDDELPTIKPEIAAALGIETP